MLLLCRYKNWNAQEIFRIDTVLPIEAPLSIFQYLFHVLWALYEFTYKSWQVIGFNAENLINIRNNSSSISI